MEDNKQAPNNQAPSNVIQFPNRKKEAETTPAPVKKPAKPKASKKTLAGTVLAIMLFTGAANRFVFDNNQGSFDQASLQADGGRHIASVLSAPARNADWEKSLAEKLASADARSIASLNVGRAATQDEKLRWGVLEEKYTITYSSADHKIESVLLQDTQSTPSYILSREKFLKEYGSLLKSNFASAKLDSVKSAGDITTETYTLVSHDGKSMAEAHFELDQHKRLLSLKVEPKQL